MSRVHGRTRRGGTFAVGLKYGKKMEELDKIIKKRIELYNKVRKMSWNRCHFCKKDVIKSCKDKRLEFGGSTVHHKTPRRHGGKDVQNNLICICDSCHKKLERLIQISENALLNSQIHSKAKTEDNGK
jgi:5-methylcytosine-specific restriction endonuclease McrA